MHFLIRLPWLLDEVMPYFMEKSQPKAYRVIPDNLLTGAQSMD